MVGTFWTHSPSLSDCESERLGLLFGNRLLTEIVPKSY